MEIENSILVQELNKRSSSYREQIKKVYNYCENILPKINNVFANYTGHGIQHSLNVMKHMATLCRDIELLSDLEIVCMIDAALLHDIGMVVTDEEIQEIKNDKLQGKRKFSSLLEIYKTETVALQESVRPIHGFRSLEHVMNMEEDFFMVDGYRNNSFKKEVGLICQAHNEDFEWISKNLKDKDVKGNHALNAQFIAMLLRIADYLDIDEKRAPIDLYKLISPTGFGDMEWRQHYVIKSDDRIVPDGDTKYKKVEIYGSCDDHKVHRKFLRYMDDVSKEITKATSYADSFTEEKYLQKVKSDIDNKIETDGFKFSDLKLRIDYHAILNLLMGEKIYGNKQYGLRELIQNSIDACKVMQEESTKLPKFNYNS